MVNMYDKRLIVFIVAIFLPSAVYILYASNSMFNKTPQRFEFHFIPPLHKVKVCEELFVNTSASGFTYTSQFKNMTEWFKSAIKNGTKGYIGEGYSGQVSGQYLAMHYLAQQPAVKTVCETGFNVGHSSFNYLTANDKSVVHSFDLGSHAYALPMSKYLTQKFPNRFFIHFGDSTKTIPKFIEENPGFTCDYMLVDGGHNYPVALADIKNFAQIANLEDNVIIFDDYPTNWGIPFGKAWEDVIKEGIVKELMRCTFRDVPGLPRGYSVGRVVKRPLTAKATNKP